MTRLRAALPHASALLDPREAMLRLAMHANISKWEV